MQLLILNDVPVFKMLTLHTKQNQMWFQQNQNEVNLTEPSWIRIWSIANNVIFHCPYPFKNCKGFLLEVF